MTQTLLAYGATAIAAVWVVWSVLLPRSLKQKLRGGDKAALPKGKAGCGSDDCGCGD
jgi:ABC-type uncharacterized transport system permease subunit